MSKTERKVEEGAHGAKRGEAAEPMGSTSSSGGRSNGGMEHDRGLLARSLVIPEIFDGTGSWCDWSFHFENVAWLRVRVTGRAQKALYRLRGMDALCAAARFEPESRYTRYQAEFQARRKRAGEGWADFADDLRDLADKAYPILQEEARERLSINAYLGQLPQPQISFSVSQKQPSTLDDTVAATLEMESYLPSQILSSVCTSVEGPEDGSTTACLNLDSIDQVSHLTWMVVKLTDQVEKLQLLAANTGAQVEPVPTSEGQPWRVSFRSSQRGFERECWNCHQMGHLAHNCPVPRTQNQLGN